MPLQPELSLQQDKDVVINKAVTYIANFLFIYNNSKSDNPKTLLFACKVTANLSDNQKKHPIILFIRQRLVIFAAKIK
jgi:hypothetical protein